MRPFHYHEATAPADAIALLGNEGPGNRFLADGTTLIDLMNAKTARSQMLGGLTFGTGMAFQEELVADPVVGRMMNASFGDYRVPVHADMPSFDISLVNEPDFNFNPLGCRGVGELGNPGATAAFANAVYNATGARIRKLPITPEKIMEALEAPAHRDEGAGLHVS